MTDDVITNTEGRENFRHWLALLLCVLSFGAALAGTWAIVAQDYVYVILEHFIAAFSGGLAGAIADRRRLGSHFFPWVISFTLPLFGGSAAYFLLETMKRPRTGRLQEEYTTYLNDAALYRDSVPIHFRAAPMELISLTDVLSNPASDAEQRIAIEYLADMETKASYEILRKAAHAKEETYFFAMTAITQMEDKMLVQLGELENKIHSSGENNADIELLLKTAKIYINFIYFQFVFGETRLDYLHRAETLLQNILNNSESEENEINQALILSGRVKLALNDNKGAIKFFSQYLVKNPKHHTGYLWRAEAWYHLGQYDRLRKDLKAAKEIGNIPLNMHNVVNFWLTPGLNKKTEVI